VSGRLRDYQKWRPIEQATLSYGHGISVSLLQLARAYTVFASDGALQPVTLLKRDAPVSGTRVISPATARAVRTMLESVVQPGGTAVRAQVLGYRVAGKTGTAHKLEGGTYAHDRYVSSFVGMAPASDPRLLVAVMIDEPEGREYYGGLVAAPVFRAVISDALRMLSVPPDAPMTIVDPGEQALDAREEV
jgi:cell division protein FtsI (penicillin-binding protein 3)